MDDARAAIVAEARRWIGTPYRHQASTLGAGCDCLGLVRGVWRAIHGAEPLPVPPYGPDWSEPRRDEALWRALTSVLSPAGPRLQPGNVLLFRMREGGVAKHLGLLSETPDETGATPRFVHAYSAHGVVESPLSLPWSRRIVARFDLI